MMRPAGPPSGMRFAGAASLQPRSGASLSSDRVYRYTLTRRWGEDNRYVLWVMLNPSTADALDDDATIRRCRGLSRGLGYDAMAVVNLFGLRSNDPTRLIGHPDPVGPGNDRAIADLAGFADVVIAAWGAMAFARSRARAVCALLSAAAVTDLKCFGITRSGAPKHPLYLPTGSPLLPYRCREAG